MTLYQSPESRLEVPALSFQSYAELLVSSGKAKVDIQPVLFDVFILTKIPPGVVVVDYILDLDPLSSSGSLSFTVGTFYFDKTSPYNYAPLQIFESNLSYDATLGYRGLMPNPYEVPMAYHHLTWLGLIFTGFFLGTFAPGFYVGHCFFRPADRDDFA